MIVMEAKRKALIGTCCPQCERGTLKKKHNRQVKPAKPFIGCDRYPRCDYAIEVNAEQQRIRDQLINLQILDECWDEGHGQN